MSKLCQADQMINLTQRSYAICAYTPGFAAPAVPARLKLAGFARADRSILTPAKGGGRLRNMRSLRGMSVVVDARSAGRVIQVLLSDDLRRMEGIWIDAGLKGVRFIDAERLSVIGSRAIIADDIGERVRLKPNPLFLRAVSTAGRRLGAVVGAEIDEVSLTVRCLILSLGYLEDLTRGEIRAYDYVYDAENRRVVIPEALIDSEV